MDQFAQANPRRSRSDRFDQPTPAGTWPVDVAVLLLSAWTDALGDGAGSRRAPQRVPNGAQSPASQEVGAIAGSGVPPRSEAESVADVLGRPRRAHRAGADPRVAWGLVGHDRRRREARLGRDHGFPRAGPGPELRSADGRAGVRAQRRPRSGACAARPDHYRRAVPRNTVVRRQRQRQDRGVRQGDASSGGSGSPSDLAGARDRADGPDRSSPGVPFPRRGCHSQRADPPAAVAELVRDRSRPKACGNRYA